MLDLEDRFERALQSRPVVVERLTEEDKVILQQLIYRHLEATDSARAREILGDWARFAGAFWKVIPRPPAAKPRRHIRRPRPKQSSARRLSRRSRNAESATL